MRPWVLGMVLGALGYPLSACDRTEGAPASGGESTRSAPTGLIKAGERAPDFEVRAHSGEVIQLSKLRGKKVVLYFYPKDDTPGCTIEAQELRDQHTALEGADTVVLGVSADDNESHAAFARKHDLPFALLPDPDHEIARAYGVPVRLGVTKRVTFVIDREGVVAKTFDDVNPNGHAAEILKVVAAL